MPGVFFQIYIQIVFAVKGRECLIQAESEDEIFKYITGVVKNKGQKLLAINGMPDHIHILIGMKPSCCLSDLVRDIKKASNDFINDKKLTRHKFAWQEGYGAFSYSHSAMDTVVRYVNNQKEHNKKQTFKEEYTEFLTRFQIEFKDEFLFEWIE